MLFATPEKLIDAANDLDRQITESNDLLNNLLQIQKSVCQETLRSLDNLTDEIQKGHMFEAETLALAIKPLVEVLTDQCESFLIQYRDTRVRMLAKTKENYQLYARQIALPTTPMSTLN